MASDSVGFDRLPIVSLSLLSLLSLLLLLSPSSTSSQTLVALSKADKQALLDAHNILRSRTALGRTGGQPSAGDMMLLEWDDRLMAKAATWAAKCQVGHDTAADRVIPGHEWVGQNWAGGHNLNLSLFVELWYEEYKDYNFVAKTCTPDKMCGHYTQVVWAQSLLVGCAAATCPSYPRILVCNYADGGNVGTNPPYASGPAAGLCIGEYTYTRAGLCLRRDQCDGMYTGGGSIGGGTGSTGGGTGSTGGGTGSTGDGTGSTGGGTGSGDGWDGWTFDQNAEMPLVKRRSRRDTDPCRCAIQCLNGGTLDSGSCKCSCTPDRYGTRCEVSCTDPEMWRNSCENDPDACKNFPMFCPKTCKTCTTGDIRDKAAVNADGVIGRVP